MIFACLYSLFTFWLCARAFHNLDAPNERHLFAAGVMWVAIGPGLVLFFHYIFNR